MGLHPFLGCVPTGQLPIMWGSLVVALVRGAAEVGADNAWAVDHRRPFPRRSRRRRYLTTLRVDETPGRWQFTVPIDAGDQQERSPVDGMRGCGVDDEGVAIETQNPAVLAAPDLCRRILVVQHRQSDFWREQDQTPEATSINASVSPSWTPAASRVLSSGSSWPS